MEEGFTVLAKEIASLVNAGNVEKARCKLARLAADEFDRGRLASRSEIDRLMYFLLNEVPLEPFDGAVDTAIRIIRKLQGSRI